MTSEEVTGLVARLPALSKLADDMRALSDEMFHENPKRSHHFVMPHKFRLVEAANGLDELISALTTLSATIDELTAARDELHKLAASLGEPDDPFAAWESLEALKAVLAFYADAELYRGMSLERAEAAGLKSLYASIKGGTMNATAPEGYVLPPILSDHGARARSAIRSRSTGDVNGE